MPTLQVCVGDLYLIVLKGFALSGVRSVPSVGLIREDSACNYAQSRITFNDRPFCSRLRFGYSEPSSFVLIWQSPHQSEYLCVQWLWLACCSA